jgi:hypothetical protein
MSREAWRSAAYISSRALFTPSLLSLCWFHQLGGHCDHSIALGFGISLCMYPVPSYEESAMYR